MCYDAIYWFVVSVGYIFTHIPIFLHKHAKLLCIPTSESLSFHYLGSMSLVYRPECFEYLFGNGQEVGTKMALKCETGVELSLCKHLLKERMGSEEAQKAFNSAKISVADFRVNGASIVTNDKLVVRVGGQYYPWISASPLVLGMLAFGQVTSQEIQGAIQVEKPDPSPSSKDVGALVTTGSGGWKLWPFPLRRPKTPERSGSAPLVSREALLVAAGAGVDSALMNNLVSQRDYYLRSRKHKVRSFLPTSQMLASMNLKEGSNRITFKFITRVLGQQQVKYPHDEHKRIGMIILAAQSEFVSSAVSDPGVDAEIRCDLESCCTFESVIWMV